MDRPEFLIMLRFFVPFLSLLIAAPLAAQVRSGEEGMQSFRIRMGVGATGQQSWDGAVTVSGGELVAVRNWHPRPEDEMPGRNDWRLTTHKMTNYVWRPIEKAPDAGTREHFWERGVIVDVKTQPGTRINVRTAQGRFAFNINEIQLNADRAYLNGRVLVDRVPPVEQLTDREHDDDYVTMLSGQGGEVWAAWVGFKDGANYVLARRFDGSAWGPLQRVTGEPGDIFLVKLGRDIKGRPWAIYSNQVDGNFDLYAKVFDGGRWGAAQRLTDAPGPDVFHNAVTDASGNLWVAWQGFRDGQSDIFARRFDGSEWSEPFQVSDSATNDWEPVLAADSGGRVTDRLGRLRHRRLQRPHAHLRLRQVGRGRANRRQQALRGARFAGLRPPGSLVGRLERSGHELGQRHRLATQRGGLAAVRVAQHRRGREGGFRLEAACRRPGRGVAARLRPAL